MYEFLGAKDWQDFSLYEIAKWKNGLAFKDIDFSESGLPVIKIAELKNGITKQTKFTNAQYSEDVSIKKGDMVFAWSGSPQTSIDTFIWDGLDGWLNQHIFKVTPLEVVSDQFLFFLLKHLRPRFVQIGLNKQTTGLGHVTVADLKEMRVGIPSHTEQENIINIVAPLQEKIENNRRMNETLEEMARAIFKSWFVDFDPVRAKMEGRPTGFPDDISDLFPNELVGSEIGQIPKGWRNITVGDLIVPKRGKTITKSKTIEGVIPVVAGGLEPAYFHNQSNVDAPVITISASGANAGFTRLYNEDIWASDCSYISRKQTDTPYFWYVFLKTYQKQIYHMQQGAAQPHIYPSDLMRLELCVPLDEKLIQYFERLALPYFQRISIAQQESKTLAELRNILLPKLISGEIRVADAERKMETAI